MDKSGAIDHGTADAAGTETISVAPGAFDPKSSLALYKHHLKIQNHVNHVGLSETKVPIWVPQLFMLQPFPQTTGETSFRWACVIQQVGHQAKPVFHPPRPSVAVRHRYTRCRGHWKERTEPHFEKKLQLVQIGGDTSGVKIED